MSNTQLVGVPRRENQWKGRCYLEIWIYAQENFPELSDVNPVGKAMNALHDKGNVKAQTKAHCEIS